LIAPGRQGGGGEHKGRPGAIHEPAFLALMSDKALRRVVITGRPDLGMPAYDGMAGRPADFQPLTSAQVDDLVALLASWRQVRAGLLKRDSISGLPQRGGSEESVARATGRLGRTTEPD
jgi:hypothetical protein